MSPHRFGSAVVASLLASSLLGCGGGGPVPVNGFVKWESGEPVSGAMVMFIPKSGGAPATGLTGDDGAFHLTTRRDKDGALPGEYKVVITKPEGKGAVGGGAAVTDPKELTELMAKAGGKKPGKGGARAAPEPKNQLPAVYAADKTTPLTWKVEGGNTNPEFKLKKS